MAEAAEQLGVVATRASVAMGARVEGIDLADLGNNGDADVIQELRELLLEHHLLVLPGQELSALELEAFGRRWGDLLTHPATKHRDTNYVQFIGGRAAKKFTFFPGVHPFGGGWHSDMTWHSTPPIITGLHAQRLPTSGGDTAFANQHLAYENLSDDLRERIADLKAFHTGKVFGPDVEDSVHPVVRTHDETGRKALYVNGNFTKYILDMPEDESELLLYALYAHSTRPEFVYRHHWEVNDLVLWDNRSVMHYAIRDYDEPRIMHRIVIKGGTPR
ncbi:MAG: TauD/TfdA family dioxygenase [Gammaproteobacteria bacterium]|nr:TauD/TfdA family dioxygenase [Gammaproteobacteria bacterium]